MRVFVLDQWQEILDVLRRNKLRALLTGFAVAWGIFMLIILLGSGTGLQHGMEYQFRDDAVNSFWLTGGTVSKPYQGLQPGRRIVFSNEDFSEIRDRVEGVEHITGRFWLQGQVTVSYRGETGAFNIRSVHPDHKFLEKTIVKEGRFLNQLDIREHRKNVAIGELVKEALFKDEPAIGKEIKINGIAFQVVGVFVDEGPEQEREVIYLPITTSQRTFNGKNKINQIMFTTGDATLRESKVMEEAVRTKLADRHNYDPEDQRAVFINNGVENFQRFVNLMGGIRVFVWIIGVGTLLAGVVGVSNIMLVAVRERTREIGVRKAVGATPGSIIGLVLQESIFITATAGYLGLLAGVALLEVLTKAIPSAEYFRNPYVDLRVAIYATLLLVLAGAVAGFFPARRAAAIKPVEALRDE